MVEWWLSSSVEPILDIDPVDPYLTIPPPPTTVESMSSRDLSDRRFSILDEY